MLQSLKTLVIDTSTPYLFLALYDQRELVDSHYQKGHNDHSVTLMDTLQEMLSSQGWKPAFLDEIIVGIGPGSYTGLRIGVVVAKMLAWSLSCRLYTVSSLALLASSVLEDGQVLAWMDARRDHAFLEMYEKTRHTLIPVDQPRYSDFKAYQNSVKNPFVLVSSGHPNMNVIWASDLAVLVTDVHQVEPFYLRDTEAERQLKDRVNNS